MIITVRFVYIHMPKTGGTFVTEVLTRIHKPLLPRPSRWIRVREILAILLPRMKLTAAGQSSPYGPLVDIEPKHGTCHDVPPPHEHKPLLSTLRNPYDWYVSQFEFAWWKRTFMY